MKQISEKQVDVGKTEYESVPFAPFCPIKIRHLVVLPDQKEAVVPFHWHRCMEIILPQKNGAEIWLDHNIFRIFPGDFLIINSCERHLCQDIYPFLEYQGYFIQVSYPFLTNHLEDFNGLYFSNDIPVAVKKRALEALEEMVQAFTKDTPYCHLEVEGYFLKFLSILLQEASHRSTLSSSVLPDILTYLGEHYRDFDSVAQIAEHFHISYSQLEKIFQKNLHMSVKQYLYSICLRNAVFQLLNSDDSMIQIAYDNGFKNVKAFYKLFKDTYQMTPMLFKKMMNERK